MKFFTQNSLASKMTWAATCGLMAISFVSCGTTTSSQTLTSFEEPSSVSSQTQPDQAPTPVTLRTKPNPASAPVVLRTRPNPASAPVVVKTQDDPTPTPIVVKTQDDPAPVVAQTKKDSVAVKTKNKPIPAAAVTAPKTAKVTLSGRSYVVKGRRHHILATAEGFKEEGMSTWYGPGFHGRKTASGEAFNQNALTAAHKTLPIGSMVEVTNKNNGKKVVVRINDRGPFGKKKFIIDLAKKAARSIGIEGIAPVSIRVISKDKK